MKKLWRRFREQESERARLKDEIATERFLRERQVSEREQGRDAPLPPAGANTDWTYIPPP